MNEPIYYYDMFYMGNKTKAIILSTLGKLQKDITFDECRRNKTYYDGVKHGIKLSKKAIEEIPKEEFDINNKLHKWFSPNEKMPNIGDKIVVQDWSGAEMDIVFDSFPTDVGQSNVCRWRYVNE